MNLERYHLVKAHERVKEAADCLQGAIVSQPYPVTANGYYRDAKTQLEFAVRELGARIIWEDIDPISQRAPAP